MASCRPYSTTRRAAVASPSRCLQLSCYLSLALLLAQPMISYGARILAKDPRIYWGGRKLLTEDGSASFDWPGVYAEFEMSDATELTMSITDETHVGTSFAIFIDGARVGVVPTENGLVSYNIFPDGWDTPKEAVTVTVQHMQEPTFINTDPWHMLTLHYFETDGKVKAAPRRPHKLEFIGDSLIAGYGIDGTFPCQPAIGTNDFTKTFAGLLCQNLTADCSVVAWSGLGVRCNWDGCGDDQVKMGERWEDTLGGSRGEYPWDYNQWKPDGVVFTIGENDLCCGRFDQDGEVDQFEEAVIDFVHHVVKSYRTPDMPIMFAVGPIVYWYNDSISRVIDQLQEEGINANYLDMVVPMLDDEPLGCDEHPSAAMNERVFEQMRPQVMGIMGWGGSKPKRVGKKGGMKKKPVNGITAPAKNSVNKRLKTMNRWW